MIAKIVFAHWWRKSWEKNYRLHSANKHDREILVQIWSLSSFEVSCQLLKNDLNQVSSVSLLKKPFVGGSPGSHEEGNVPDLN